MSGFDFSGMDCFWQIFALLQADKEQAEEQWDRLFATPGFPGFLTRLPQLCLFG